MQTILAPVGYTHTHRQKKKTRQVSSPSLPRLCTACGQVYRQGNSRIGSANATAEGAKTEQEATRGVSQIGNFNQKPDSRMFNVADCSVKEQGLDERPANPPGASQRDGRGRQD